MKRYGIQNDIDDGDTLANCMNARKSSLQRTDGKGALRKRQLRTMMNKRKRQALKNELKKEL